MLGDQGLGQQSPPIDASPSETGASADASPPQTAPPSIPGRGDSAALWQRTEETQAEALLEPGGDVFRGHILRDLGVSVRAHGAHTGSERISVFASVKNKSRAAPGRLRQQSVCHQLRS